ncbi:MAG: hypothetical protein J6T55_00610 [Alphaproteobacteria bacterium]|nr:hypothetical protein [Alphaproteobacteria bacterium]
MKEYLSQFKYGKTFECFPKQMEGMGHFEIFGRGAYFEFCLGKTKVDMIPAGLKGVESVHFDKKPLFIAPDFEGEVTFNDFTPMKEKEIKEAKARYNRFRKWVESPRYIEESDGTLSLCSLPKDIKIANEYRNHWHLDLTQTDITEGQGFKVLFADVTVHYYPKRVSLSDMPTPQKVSSHKRKVKTSFSDRQRG